MRALRIERLIISAERRWWLVDRTVNSKAAVVVAQNGKMNFSGIADLSDDEVSRLASRDMEAVEEAAEAGCLKLVLSVGRNELTAGIETVILTVMDFAVARCQRALGCSTLLLP